MENILVILFNIVKLNEQKFINEKVLTNNILCSPQRRVLGFCCSLDSRCPLQSPSRTFIYLRPIIQAALSPLPAFSYVNTRPEKSALTAYSTKPTRKKNYKGHYDISIKGHGDHEA